MPQPKDFKFTLEWKGTEYEFQHSPDGWADYSTKWVRHKDYYGFSRTFIEELRFFKEACDIIRKANDEKGIEALVYLKVYRLNRANWEYQLDFVGELDFTRLVDDELYDDIAIASGGTEQLLEAYAKVDYDVPIGTDYKITVPEGIKLRETAMDVIAAMPSAGSLDIHKLPLMVASDELKTDSLKFNDVEYGTVAGTACIEKTDSIPVTLTITTRLSDSSDNPLVVWLREPSGVSHQRRYRIRMGSDEAGEFHEITSVQVTTGGDNTITLNKVVTITNPGKYHLYAVVDELNGDPLPSGINVQYKTGTILFDYAGTTSSFYFYGMPLKDYFQKLGEKMGITQPFTSELLTAGEGRNIFITSGDAIRGFDDAVIRDRFTNLYFATDAVLNVGLGIKNEGLTLEKKELFFDRNRQELSLGEVSKLQVMPAAEEWIFNTIEVGYEDQTYDEANGRDEFNTLLSFATPITKYSEKLDLVSPIRADSYGIQFTRLNLQNKETTDSSSDNKTFFVVVKETANGYEVDREKEEISGTINPTGVFNVFLSPKRCLLRHASYLLSMLDKQTGAIEFTSIAKQESNLDSRLVAEPGVVSERASISIDSLREATQPLFSPFIVKFTTAVPYNLPFLLGSNPTGYIAFTYNGVSLKGFIVQVTEKPALRKEQEWELLLHPDTPSDLLFKLRDKTGKLIR